VKKIKKYEQSDLENLINDSYISNAINYFCHTHPNDSELGAIVRKHFQKL